MPGKQLWPERPQKVQGEQDIAFVRAANPGLYSDISQIEKLRALTYHEPGPEVFKATLENMQRAGGVGPGVQSPEQQASFRELMNLLKMALNDPKVTETMFEAHLNVLSDYIFEDLSIKEIAEKRKPEATTVKGYLGSAFVDLRRSGYLKGIKISKPRGRAKGWKNW